MTVTIRIVKLASVTLAIWTKLPKPRVSQAVRCAWRSGEMRTTFQANPSRSKASDDQCGGVYLPAPQAVNGGARKSVVIVVPGLSQRRKGEPEDIGRAIIS